MLDLFLPPSFVHTMPALSLLLNHFSSLKHICLPIYSCHLVTGEYIQHHADTHTFLFSTDTNTDLFTQFTGQLIFTALLTEACLLSKMAFKKNSQVTNRTTLQRLDHCLRLQGPSYECCPGGARESTDDITRKDPTKASIPQSVAIHCFQLQPDINSIKAVKRCLSLSPHPPYLSPATLLTPFSHS